MKRAILRTAATLATLAFLATPLLAADPATGTEGMPAMDPQMKAFMEACMKAGTPGTEHKLIQSMAGTWDFSMTHWMAPDSPPMVDKGTSIIKPLFDGRYVQEEVAGTSVMPGMPGPFRGLGISGYDTTKQKYTSVWIDNMNTAVMTSLGDCDEQMKNCTYVGTYDDPLTKKPMTMRMVFTTPEANKRVGEFYMPGLDGKEYKGMVITYTRKSPQM